ncbi:MAG: fibronectin type III domain-containing protein [Bacteroidaceae bacterium]|nr:fibronectin type III domain-containing protein [Bacteroidaceae bacterium]
MTTIINNRVLAQVLSMAARMAACLMLMLLSTFTVGATEYVAGVKVIGGSESEVTALKKTLTSQGWKCCDMDLNDNAGGDYIYLLYWTSRLNTEDTYITDFYVRVVETEDSAPSTIEHNGRTYHLVPYDGGTHFKNLKGDLNSNAGGAYIHLYYTTDDFPDLRAVTEIYFVNVFHRSGSLPQNGKEGTYADFNDGIINGNEHNNDIYMKINSQRKAEQLMGDVRLIGGSKGEVNTLKGTLTEEGWTLVDMDLNKGCGSSSDYIYLLYQPTDELGDGNFITDFYISDADDVDPTIEHDGRTYYLVTCDGGDHFMSIEGDLNSHAGGADIHLYYTTDPFPDHRAVFDIQFNDAMMNALGRNGKVSGAYNLNQGTSGDEIYMHMATWAVPDSWGAGTKDSPLVLRTQDSWDAFVANVAGGRTYAGEYLQLAGDMDVTTMVGTAEHPFSGQLNGDGHTLTVNLQATESVCAPFRYLQDATLSNLNVRGTVQGGTSRYLGGLAGRVGGSTTIRNCIVTTAVSSTAANGMQVGGLVEETEASVNLTISNCAFKGSILCPDGFGISGFLGYAYVTDVVPTLSFRDCLFAPQRVQVSSEYTHLNSTFAHISDGKEIGSFTNCYYVQALENIQGVPVSPTRIAGVWDEPVTAADGETYYLQFITTKSLPYTYDCSTSLEEDGWEMKDCAGGTGLQSGVFRFESAFQYQYLLSPIFDGSVPIRLTFTASLISNVYAGIIFVGYTTSIEDDAEIHWTSCNLTSKNCWFDFEISLPLGTRRVIFCSRDSGMIFNLTNFRFAPDTYLPPTQLSVKDTGPRSFAFGWEARETSVSNIGFAYQYKKASDEEWSEEQTVQTPNVRISGLTPGTDYQFRVRTRYQDAASTYATLDFHTPTFMELPYDCSFENGMDGLTMVTSVGESPYYFTGITPTNGRELLYRTGERCFRFYSSQSKYGTQYLKTLYLPDGNAKRLTFYYKCGGMSWEEYFWVGYSTVGSDPSYFNWETKITCTNYNNWKKYEIMLPAEAVCAAFKYTSEDTYGVLIDDLTIEEYATGAVPEDLTATDLSEEMATKLTWKKPDASVTGYAYQYKKATDNAWSAPTNTTATSVTLNSLDTNKDYFFRVKALYGNSSSYYTMVSFLSDGGIQQLPFDWGFEGQLGGFRTVNNVLETKVVGFDGAGHTGKWCFRFSPTVGDHGSEQGNTSEPQYLLSPRFNPASAIKYSFFYRITSQVGYDFSTAFQAGYSTQTNDIEDFTWGSRIDVSELGWQQYVGYAPVGTKYIAIKWLPGGAFLMVDDLHFEDFAYLDLADNAGNTAAISANNGKPGLITLKNRTLNTSGIWNTLCLPFKVDHLRQSALDGFIIKELDTEADYNGHRTGVQEGALYLNFKDASTIEAGRSYIVRYGRVKGADAGCLKLEAGNGSPSFDGEESGRLFDGDAGTKWCTTEEYKYEGVWYTYFTASNPVKVTGYTLTTGNDTQSNPGRNPKRWQLQARATENDSWTTIDIRNVNNNGDDALPGENYTSKSFAIASDKQGVYRYFNFIVQETEDDIMQLSELTLQGTIDANTQPDITNPAFEAVVSASTPAVVTSQDGKVSFTGTYNPLSFTAADQSVLFIGTQNRLFYPESGAVINPHRAYFQLNGIEVGTPNGIKSFNLNFGDEDETTGIAHEVEGSGFLDKPSGRAERKVQGEDSWHDLSGRRLSVPSASSVRSGLSRGIYINNGKKIVIK